MAEYSLTQGDLGEPMVIDLGVAAAIAALATAQSVQLRWQKPDKTVSIVAMTVVDANAGTVQRTWVAGDTDVVGMHRGQVLVTDSAGNPITDPNDGSYLYWEIYPKLG